MQPSPLPHARHVVMSFVSADDATTAVLLLMQRGFDATAVSCYTPAQMRRSGPLSRLGLPLHLLIAQRELGRRGHSIVAARAVGERMVESATDVGRETHAHSLQCWDGYRLEELLAPVSRPRTRRAMRGAAAAAAAAAKAAASAAAAAVTASSTPPSHWQTAALLSTAP